MSAQEATEIYRRFLFAPSVLLAKVGQMLTLQIPAAVLLLTARGAVFRRGGARLGLPATSAALREALWTP